jgi:outer membrane protein assembly factor BamB
MRAKVLGSRRIASIVTAGLLALAIAPARAQWEGWRGPGRDGTSRETGLPGTWSADGENLVWKSPIGARSTPVVHGDRLYLQTRGGEGPTEHERIACLSTSDGRLLWEHRMPIFLTDIPSNRVGWSSPAVDPETGNVHAHGIQGLFVALDRDGKLLWSRSLTEEFGKFSGYGGRVQTPLVDGDLVIVSFLNSSWGEHGKMWHRFAALDKRTGEVRWWASPGGAPLDTNYSTPVVIEVDGARLLVAGGGDGAVHALQVRTGEPVWSFRLSKRGINPAIVADGARVFTAHSEENLDATTMGRVVAIDATGRGDVTGSKEIWRIDGLQVGYASPALHEGRLHVIDNSANLECIDGRDGKRLWKHSLGTVGKGSPVWADGKIFATEVNGRFHILEDGASGPRSLDVEEFHSPDGTVVEIYGSPAVAGGRVYISTRDATYAIGAPGAAGSGPPAILPAAPGSGSAAPSKAAGAPARLVVVPADVLLAPGETVSFRGLLFDAKGNPAGEVTPDLAAQGIRGAVSGARFAASAEVPFGSGTVEARAGDLRAQARVRVIPRLAMEEDFEKVEAGKLPAGWIGLSPLKFRIAERDGGRVLEKLATDPKFLRADVYLGRPGAARYAFEADVMGTQARRNLPDFGIIACRYTFYLTRDARDRKPIARAVSWLPMPRLQKDAPFPWRPDVWYRMKMRVDPVSEGGVVRCKVWSRNEAEPREWTIEMEDPMPTLEGSPGFTAFTPGITEKSPGPAVFFDNFRVSPEAER